MFHVGILSGRKPMRDEQINLHLGKRLAQRRRSLRLTQSALAEQCGVSYQQIQKYECAASGISAAKLVILARALDVPITYFTDGLPEAVVASVAPIPARWAS